MRKVLLGGAAMAVLMANPLMSAPVMAADLPVEAPIYAEPPPVVGLLNWTGFYVGGNIGYARSPGSADIMVAGVPLFSLSETMSGVIGGAQAGANWQTGNAVFGIEADIQGTSQSVSDSMTVVDVSGAVNVPGATVTAINADKITSFGTVRGRLGIASGRALFFATGGWAYWTWTSNLTVAGLGTASLSNFQGGGAIGAGVEYAIASNWTVKAEYLYLQSTTISNAPFIARPDVIVNTRIRDNVFRVGVNYMFFTGSVGCRPHVC